MHGESPGNWFGAASFENHPLLPGDLYSLGIFPAAGSGYDRRSATLAETAARSVLAGTKRDLRYRIFPLDNPVIAAILKIQPKPGICLEALGETPGGIFRDAAAASRDLFRLGGTPISFASVPTDKQAGRTSIR